MSTEDTTAIAETTIPDTPDTVIAYVSSDWLLHATPEAREAHEAGLKHAKIVIAFIDYMDYKGRSKSHLGDAIRAFLAWNAAGRPTRVPAPPADAPPADAPPADAPPADAAVEPKTKVRK